MTTFLSNIPFKLESKKPNKTNIMPTHLERIQKVIAYQLGVDLERVIPAAKLEDDLGADSLDAVELVMALDEEFKVNIPDDEAEKFLTVQDIADYIANLE